MKRALFAFGILIMTASAANAGGLVSKHASSVQLTVNAAQTTATRDLMLKTQGAIEYLEATGVKLPEPEVTEEAETEVSETEVVEEG